MNEHTEFEKLVKDKFANSFEQPEDLLWKRLNDQLQHNDEKVKRRKFIIWGVSSLSVLVVLIGTVLFGSNNSDNQKYTTSENQQTAPELRKTKIAKVQSESTSFNMRNERVIQTGPKANKNKISFVGQKQDLNTQVSFVPKNNGAKSGNYNHKNKTDLSSPHFEQIGDIDKIERNHVKQTTAVNHEDLLLDIPVNKETIIDPLTIHSFDETKQHDKSTVEGVDTKSTVAAVNSTEDVKTVTADTSTSEKTEIVNVPPADVLKVASPALRTWFIGVQLNPSYSSRQLMSNTANSSKVDFYNSHEEGQMTMSFGAFGGLELNKNFSIRSGLSYSAYTSTVSVSNMSLAFDTLDNNLNIETEYGDYSIQQDEFDDDSEDEDPEEEELNEGDSTILNLSYTNSQTLNFIQVPIYCEFGFNRNKWKWSIGTGLIYGYLANAKTEFTTTGYAPVNRNNTSQFNRNSLCGSLNIGVEYALSSQFSLKAAPQFSYMFTPINSANQLTIKPFWAGLDFSLKYYLK